jgi:hypothetical protein
VLKAGGLLCAATNGESHMDALHDLVKQFRTEYRAKDRSLSRFSLQSGPGQLKSAFPEVEVRPYLADLEVTEVEPILAYIRSMWEAFGEFDQAQLFALAQYVQEHIDQEGAFFIGKSQGLILGRLAY